MNYELDVPDTFFLSFFPSHTFLSIGLFGHVEPSSKRLLSSQLWRTLHPDCFILSQKITKRFLSIFSRLLPFKVLL